MANIFSDVNFLTILGATYYPDASRKIATCSVAGQRFQLLCVADRPVTEHPLVDFFEPIAERASGAMSGTTATPKRAAWIPRMSQRFAPISDRSAIDYTCLAPYIDWSLYPTWADWQAHFKATAKAQAQVNGSFIDIPRQRRRLEKQLGTLKFVAHDPNPDLLAAFFDWKSQRYRDIGAPDLWATATNRQFITALHQAGLLKVAVLTAADQPIALHLGFEQAGRFYWWLPTFDQQLQRFSAGRILLEELLAHSFAQGQGEFDFLNGEEVYKWCYATHSRIVESLGSPPVAFRIKRKLQNQLQQTFGASSATVQLARRLYHKIR